MSHCVRRWDSSQADLIARDIVRPSIPVILSILPSSLSCSTSSRFRGFDQELQCPTPESLLCASASHEDLLCLPTSAKDIHFQFCLEKKRQHMGCHMYPGKQCVFCQIHLKRQILGSPGSCLSPAVIRFFWTAWAGLSQEALELCLFC